MKSLDGRGLLSLALTCALAFCLVPGVAPAQDATSPGVLAGDVDAPSYLGPKPKPLRRSYVEPSASPEAPSAPRTKTRKPKRVAVAPAPRPSAKPKAVSQPKAKAPKAVKPAKPARSVKPAKPAKPAPKPRPVAVAPAPVKSSLKPVQQALNRAGYPAPMDGKLGKSTRRALRHFQRDRGLAVTGQPDRPTLIKLGLK
jgi:hypothetical protein